MKSLLLMLLLNSVSIAFGAQLTISPEDMQPSSMALVCDKIDCVNSLHLSTELTQFLIETQR